MSRAFVNEDWEPPRRTGDYQLPDVDAQDFPAAAARMLLEAARVSEVSDCEAATGLRWADPRFASEVRRILDEAIAVGDDRLEVVASRYLREVDAAG